MHLGNIFFRTTTFVVFINMCVAEKPSSSSSSSENLQKSNKKSLKYPSKIHDLYQNQIIEKKAKLIGVWSEWSPWSKCSQTCGGGITQQIRHCITRPADSRFVKRQRRRRQNGKPSNECVGLYKRIHLCNSQECPKKQDLRSEQCAAFNNRLFKGKTYYWEPFYQGKSECSLNCRPRGLSFYATLNKTVIDGTPCYHPVSSTGKAARKGTKGVCIEGYCKTVNAQGVVGGNDDNDQQECLTCLRGTCRTIKGIYTRPDLPPGYSLVVQIPAGSCGTYVQQIKHTRNLLALKISGNSTYILNGDWKFGPSRTFDAAGTKISYIKQDGTSLETIHAPGHLTSSLDIMIVNYQLNSGIKYRYSLPVDGIPPLIAPPLIKRSSINSFDSSINSKNLETYQNSSFTSQRDDPKSANSGAYQTQRPRHRRKNFHWKITGLTPCSKSCDGGTQNYIRTCYRTISSTHHIVINEKRCAHLESPALSAISCNTEPCINNNGFWDGKWGPCSVTCGEGVQQYHHQCKQEINGNVAAEVADIHCGRFNKPSPESRVCQEKECEVFKDLADNELPQVVVPSSSANNNNAAERKDWTVGSWSQCSHSCGTGHKSRSVICPSGQCHPEKRPVHVEYCNLGSCETSSIIIDSSQNAAKPTSSKSSLVPASNNNNNDDSVHSWLISDWSHCSVRCGIGNQTRIAFCETGFCNADTKPEISRACSSDKFCDAQWFAGPWGDCSDSCSGPAKQLREVLCIARIRGVPHVTNDMVCPIGSKPHEEQPCSGICPPQWFSGDWGKCEGNCPSGVQRRDVRCLDIDKRQSNNCPEDKIPSIKRPCACESRRNSRDNVTHKLLAAQDEPIDRSCVDRIQKCRLAVQARLCNYPFYTKNCCESCRKAQQDQIE